MKRTISTLLLVLICLTPISVRYWIQETYGAECEDSCSDPVQLARMSPPMLGASSGAAAACSTPTGDIVTEGFETCAADGSDCTQTWTNGGTGETRTYNYDLTGTPPDGSCAKGLRALTTTAVTNYSSINTGSAHTTHYRKFTFKVASHSIAVWGSKLFECDGTDVACSGAIISLKLYNHGTNGLMIRAVGTTNVDVILPSPADGWHTIEIKAVDNSAGWFKIDGGEENVVTGADMGATSGKYFTVGEIEAFIADVIFGYYLVDANGSY